MKLTTNKSFGINDNKGFHVVLPNGVTISTQFGGGNYCENRRDTIGDGKEKQSNNCEFAAWDKSGNWITQKLCKRAGLPDPGDDVIGHVNVSDWLKLLNAAQRIKS